MGRVWALVVYLALVFVAGGLLAPWLYWFAGWIALFLPFVADVAASPFHRFVNRSLLLAALVGLVPLLRYLRINSWRDLGLRPQNGWHKQVAIGFGWGFVSLGLLAAAALLFGTRAPAHKPPETILKGLALAALAAVVVAFLEELLFRGVFFGSLRRVRNWVGAMLISSGIYSMVHFFQKPPIQPADVTWLSGLQMLPVMARGFGAVETLVPGFFVLLIAGMALAAAYQRTGTLHFSIGLHAGWIFWQKSYGLLTSSTKIVKQTFWGSAKITDGWLALIVLLFLLAWLLRPTEALGLQTQPIVKRA